MYRLGDAAPTLASTLDLPDPTWLCWSAHHELLYISHSGGTLLSAIRLDENGVASLAHQVDIGSLNPAHVALDDANANLWAACFSSGEVVRVALGDDGAFVGVELQQQMEGLAPAATRRNTLQSGAEPHQVVPFGQAMLVPDRAQDAVHRFDETGHSVAVTVRPGGGPRHLVPHPAAPVAYLACELDNSLVTLDAATDGSVAARSWASTLPADWFGDSAVGAITIDAARDRLFVTNRGHDSIAVFDISDPAEPVVTAWLPSGGHPRFAEVFAELGVLAVAARDDDRVDLLSLDAAATGLPNVLHTLPHLAPAGGALVVR